MISHGKFVSIYNIEQAKWVNHLLFESSEVYSLQERKLGYYSETNYSVDAILKNGDIYFGL